MCFFFRLVPFPFSFSKRRKGKAVRRRSRSGRVFPLLMWLLLLPSWTREETTMTSRKDRVLRGRTAPDTTMPEQRSQKKFAWVSVMKENSRKMCAVIPPWWTRSIRTMSGSKEADPCSNSDRSSKRVQFNRIDHQTTESILPTIISGLNVHGLKGYRCDRCPKTKVQNGARYQALNPDYSQNAK